jgi:hypothetical protein
MPIPTETDMRLGEIADLAALVLIKLRNLQRTGGRGDPVDVEAALERYCEAVKSLAGIE